MTSASFDVLHQEISTARLKLVPACGQFVQELREYSIENRAHLQPWEPLRAESFFEAESVAQRLSTMAHNNTSGQAVHLLLISPESGEMMGECNFTNIVRGPFQACHLGFSVGKRFEGRGLMREALTPAISYIFDHVRLHRIMANFRSENVRSAQLLERLGFDREGLARSYLKINGVWADHVLTSLVNNAAD
ncbi:GNAT family N-acetyltransferase [Paraburkholderia fungorum]|uniref:Ribosomal-protein-alanine N-acetyltransferase n=1 Tax=Paraburkholderia fungorum TaxID=134537 RepID=A0AAW3UQN2_9BURK|nr:GNAT family N-acetyltransferase [Paraburkholderia fungorum]MBB4513667.1 ribosomal-protein-alanine N-acetyltransferase [Paraburkholderia fungorum]MBB6200908.1 ribosomal-protein-alanine N-acetyltransferase [Paraburkholderia fungorum]